MSSYRMHLAWPVSRGLFVWIEDSSTGGAVSSLTELKELLPSSIWAALTLDGLRPHFPHVHPTSLTTVPCLELSNDEAIDFLIELAKPKVERFFSHSDGISLATDASFFLALARGISEFIRRGRVTFRLDFENMNGGRVPLVWELSSSLVELGFLDGFHRAASPQLHAHNGKGFVKEAARHMTDALVRRQLAGEYSSFKQFPHILLNHLIDSTEPSPVTVEIGSHMSEELIRWNRGDTDTEVTEELVFMLGEPEDSDDDDQEETSSTQEEPTRETLWPLYIALRNGDEPPRVIDETPEDRRLGTIVDTLVAKASKVFPLNEYGIDDSSSYTRKLSQDQVLQFIDAHAKKLTDAGFTVLIPQAWLRPVTPRVRLNAIPNYTTGDRLSFDSLIMMSWTASVGNAQISREELARLEDTAEAFVKIRGQWTRVNTSTLRAARKHFGAMEEQETTISDAREKTANFQSEIRDLGVDTPLYDPSADPEDPPVASIDALEDLADLLGVGGNPYTPELLDVPDLIEAELRSYQVVGYSWMAFMSDSRLGCILADDMGLGKTLQTLCLIARDVEEARKGDSKQAATLIVGVTAVVDNWAQEAAQFAPGLKVYMHYGSDRLHGQELKQAIEDADIVITSYGVVRLDGDELSKFSFLRIVADEAHIMKNSEAQTSRAMRQLVAHHRVALTGTPVQNHLDDLWSIMEFCNPGLLGTASEFRTKWRRPIERNESEEVAVDLKRFLAPFIMRRLKSESGLLGDLPVKREHRVSCELTIEQQVLYRKTIDVLKQAVSNSTGINRRGIIFKLLQALKQICDHPEVFLAQGHKFLGEDGQHRSGKIKVLDEILDQALDEDRHVLIFTQYVRFIELLKNYLSERYGQPIDVYTGNMTAAARTRVIQRFTSNSGSNILILSTLAGGTGINLANASVVIHMDRWWNPAIESQATDRAYRIGQENDVDVYTLIAEGTVEDRIDEILKSKVTLADSVVGAGQKWFTEMSEDELNELIELRQPARPQRTEYTDARAAHTLITSPALYEQRAAAGVERLIKSTDEDDGDQGIVISFPTDGKKD